MNYTISQLKIFLKVVKHGSVTKAADELHLTQPAVSIQLKNFQKNFTNPLTEIINKKLFVTDFGKEIALAAENIILELETINYKSIGYNNVLSGKLKISIISTGKYIMPFFLADFLQQHSNIDLELDVTNKAKVVNSLEKNEIDFALVSILPENIQIKKVDLMENKLMLVGNKKTAQILQQQKFNLDTIPLIYREIGSGTRQTMEQFIQKNKLQPKKKITLTSNEAVKQAIIAGMGVSIMPIIGIKNELASGKLEVIPIKGLPIITTWSLIWLKEKKLSAIAQAYIDFLKLHKESISEVHFNMNI
ncbi:MAG: LysR family transcriptional regulator [Chitinophagaceae bacterium]|jgi:DNA-binding transcriptional LysR family regulator|nr:LysR family transcriptional regulator [Sediminibacterium sp.]